MSHPTGMHRPTFERLAREKGLDEKGFKLSPEEAERRRAEGLRQEDEDE